MINYQNLWEEVYKEKLELENKNLFLTKNNKDMHKENTLLLKYNYELENKIKQLKGII